MVLALAGIWSILEPADIGSVRHRGRCQKLLATSRRNHIYSSPATKPCHTSPVQPLKRWLRWIFLHINLEQTEEIFWRLFIAWFSSFFWITELAVPDQFPSTANIEQIYFPFFPGTPFFFSVYKLWYLCFKFVCEITHWSRILPCQLWRAKNAFSCVPFWINTYYMVICYGEDLHLIIRWHQITNKQIVPNNSVGNFNFPAINSAT